MPIQVVLGMMFSATLLSDVLCLSSIMFSFTVLDDVLSVLNNVLFHGTQ